ncbi:hypothetical protein OAJ95_01040 [Pelagibacteraceae bacterium]|nr:hypothetical protein [Pelagibacteraceae bacterium]
MKKLIYSFTFIILFLPSVVFAGACPILGSEIEDKISNLDQTKHKTIINIAIMLHEEGMKAHDSGNHDLSEELLNGALRLLDI